MSSRKTHLKRDFFIMIASIVFAVLLVETGILTNVLSAPQFKVLGSFIAGIFFTSAFTMAPAAIALGQSAEAYSPFWVALYGSMGALVGDLILLFLIRDSLNEDITALIKKMHIKKYLRGHHFGFLKWLSPLLGAVIIASPLPDEMGIALLGVSKIKMRYVVPISFVMNYIGILLIIGIAGLFK
jgi:hypothetical protein